LAQAGLFESGGGAGHLPAVGAPPAALEAVGALLCKYVLHHHPSSHPPTSRLILSHPISSLPRCVLDDHPIGFGLCPFIYDQLVFAWGGDSALSLRDPRLALAALHGFDEPLANAWRALLDEPTQVTACPYSSPLLASSLTPEHLS
jgi:hypothetical protein